MALAPGTRLGPYEILSAIGAGGMGEVYRATDSNLKRSVAIKVLPASVAGDADRLARFRREAEVLAALNHPNIAAIYGLERAGDMTALVMELVEGEDLSQRIARGAIPIDEALPIAKQIAEALEAAHEQGIIHRDLKPANIKVRADGTVKVLDFGLAKALDPHSALPAGAALANSPTITSPAAMTAAGVILGTAPYMAPEQARGKSVDKRADVWAFGVVLLEMLTGRRAFGGEETSDVLASVLRQDVDWTMLPAATPPRLRRLLGRCLDRDVKQRLRDIGEARIELEGVAQGPDWRDVSLPPADQPRRRTWVVALTIVLTAATAFGAAWLLRARERGPAVPVRLEATLPFGVTIPVDRYNVLAISRDGSRVAIVGATDGVNRLYLRTLSDFEARPLAGTEGAAEPFFSPDGAWIGFLSNNNSLKKISVDRGLVVPIAAAGSVRGAVWNDADTIIYAETGTAGLSVISASGGTPRSLTTLNAQEHERTHRLPSLLPDGKTVLFDVGTLASPEDYDDATIEAVRLDTGERKVVVQGGRMPTYMANGELLYVRGTVLYGVAFDPRRLEVHGRARPIIDGVLGDPTTGASFFAVSDSGVLTYVPGNLSPSARQLAWVEPGGKTTPIDLPPALYTEPHPSPDGKRLTFSVVVEGSRDRDVWVADPARGTSFRLTTQGTNWTPIWSLDGQRVFSVSYDGEKDRSTVEVRAADGGGGASRIGVSDGVAFLDDMTPDGKTLFIAARLNNDARMRLYQLGSAGGGDSRPVEVPIPIAANVSHAAISPDGRWLAYAIGGYSSPGQKPEVYVQSMESGGGRVQIFQAEGSQPHWSADGREVYVLNSNNELFAVPLGPGPALTLGRPRRLSISVLPLAVESAQTYNVDPKSGRILVMRTIGERRATPQVRFMLNALTDTRRDSR